MKLKTKLHFMHVFSADQLTNIVTILAITGDIIAITLHEHFIARLIGVLFLVFALHIALGVYYKYHCKQIIKKRKVMIIEKINHIKHKVKHDTKRKCVT